MKRTLIETLPRFFDFETRIQGGSSCLTTATGRSNMSLAFGGRCGLVVSLQVILIISKIHLCTADSVVRTSNLPKVRVLTKLDGALIRREHFKHNNQDFVGFIPELLLALKERHAIPDDYKIIGTKDREIGVKDKNGNWTGIIGDVIDSSSDTISIGVGPILDNADYAKDVLMSTYWTKVRLQLIVKKTSNVTTLKQALDADYTPYIVEDSMEYRELEKTVKQKHPNNLTDLLNRLQNGDGDRLVSEVVYGLDRVEREDQACLVLNSLEALYYVTHRYCDLKTSKQFLMLGHYAFVIPKIQEAEPIRHNISSVLKTMRQDGSLDRLIGDHLGIEERCEASGSLQGATGPVIAWVVAALLTTYARILT